jgi:hypothetical protein
MTEPDAIQDNGIEPVNNIPKCIGSYHATPECFAMIDITNQQAQKHTKHKQRRYLFNIENNTSRLITIINQSEGFAAFDYSWRVIEYALYGIPGQ